MQQSSNYMKEHDPEITKYYHFGKQIYAPIQTLIYIDTKNHSDKIVTSPFNHKLISRAVKGESRIAHASKTVSQHKGAIIGERHRPEAIISIGSRPKIINVHAHD